jgi:hypothetical protein
MNSPEQSPVERFSLIFPLTHRRLPLYFYPVALRAFFELLSCCSFIMFTLILELYTKVPKITKKVKGSVADPDPGSGIWCLFEPGPRIRDPE